MLHGPSARLIQLESRPMFVKLFYYSTSMDPIAETSAATLDNDWIRNGGFQGEKIGERRSHECKLDV